MSKHQTKKFAGKWDPCHSWRVMNKLRNSKLAQAGFSLVELLVVIAVIAIIAGIAIPQITGARDAAINATAAADLEEQTRFINNVNAAGATNASGAGASVANITDTFTATIGTNSVVFQLNDN
jgi:prepilin-type N-terminal cleavage/methylation domain-containing protein